MARGAHTGGLLLLALLLAACGGVKVRPDHALPRPLVQPMTAKAGLVIDEELRAYTHEETRAGNDWKIELGSGHDALFRGVFAHTFEPLQVFGSLDEARAATGLQVIFRPQIEQYSFATANETAGAYWAVTIRYRIAVLSPAGEPVDTLTLTGYGSSLGAGRSATSLNAATRAAIRDAAAKFLVQVPRHALAQRLKAGEVLSAADAAAAAAEVIETVPIEAAPAG